MSDYTKHKDPSRKQRYMNRHKSREDWTKPMSAGALSRYILWNKPTLKDYSLDLSKALAPIYMDFIRDISRIAED